jgi:hypothetical protein
MADDYVSYLPTSLKAVLLRVTEYNAADIFLLLIIPSIFSMSLYFFLYDVIFFSCHLLFEYLFSLWSHDKWYN